MHHGFLNIAVATARAQIDRTRAEQADLERQLNEETGRLGAGADTPAHDVPEQTERELADLEGRVVRLTERLEALQEEQTRAEQRIAQAQRSLDNCTVRAPFSGIAVSKDAQIGEIGQLCNIFQAMVGGEKTTKIRPDGDSIRTGKFSWSFLLGKRCCTCGLQCHCTGGDCKDGILYCSSWKEGTHGSISSR